MAGAITQSLAKHAPSTSTPTSAALQGAVDHAAAWVKAHPGHAAIALLATDGLPTECSTAVDSVATIAQAAYDGSPAIPTFVVGVGPSLTDLNKVAAAGGTSAAFFVDTAAGDVNQQFLTALDNIRRTALGCAYILPRSTTGPLDYANVNVQYTAPGATTPVTIPNVDDKAHCPATGDGWYYDSNTAPTQVLLCASSCATAKDARVALSFVTGCRTATH